MRVISGSARGRRLISPVGMDVRPTTDKVKESMFNILQFELADTSVLDLFAGTGQLGVEALSRGAAKAVFVDSSGKSLDTVKQNISLAGFDARAKTVLSDAFLYLETTADRFDIVLLDPPYCKGLCEKAFGFLPRVLNEGALVLCETKSEETLPESFGEFRAEREYRYSSVKLTVYRQTTGEDEE